MMQIKNQEDLLILQERIKKAPTEEKSSVEAISHKGHSQRFQTRPASLITIRLIFYHLLSRLPVINDSEITIQRNIIKTKYLYSDTFL
jgi:hypothetical protein